MQATTDTAAHRRTYPSDTQPSASAAFITFTHTDTTVASITHASAACTFTTECTIAPLSFVWYPWVGGLVAFFYGWLLSDQHH